MPSAASRRAGPSIPWRWLLPLLAAVASACGNGPPDVDIDIGLDPPPCAAAGNPAACRLHRALDNQYTEPNTRDN